MLRWASRSATRNDWVALGGELVLSPLPHSYLQSEALPSSFSWADKDGRSYLTLTRNQNLPQYCNSGWAHATTSSLADRIQIQQNASRPPMGPAPQVLLNCYSGGDCSGGDPAGVYIYTKKYGLPDDTVQSYQAVQKPCQPHGRAEWCDYNLTAGCQPLGHHDQPPSVPGLPPTPFPLYSVSEYGAVAGTKHIQAEIFARGPISCGVAVSRTLSNYSGGSVLSLEPPVAGAKLSHEVSVYGWGIDEETGEAYWRVRNSYGSHWGDSGHARISATKDGGLATDCSWAVPSLSSPPTTVRGGSTSAITTTGSKNSSNTDRERRRLPRVARGGRLAKRTRPRRPSVVHSPLPQDYISDEDVPESYDTRSIFGQDYTTVSRSQNIPHACGSCWIQASVSAVSDRIKLMRRAAFPEIVLAAQVALDCANQNATTFINPPDDSFTDDNCVGGHPDDVLDLLHKYGLPDDTCQSYQGIKQDCSPQNVCRSCPHDGCVAVSNPKRYHILEHGEVLGEVNMTKEILARGPIAATIAVPDALEEYRGVRTPPELRTLIPGTSIFNDTTGVVTEDHVIEITGWGVDRGVKYWVK